MSTESLPMKPTHARTTGLCAADLLARVARGPRRDPFHSVGARTRDHRRDHGCWAYTYGDGPLLVAIAEVAKPRHVLELGTALGYSALCLASAGATVDTIERDDVHVALARLEIRREGFEQRVHVHRGDFLAVMGTLGPSFDLAFFDGFAATTEIYDAVAPRLAPGAVLVSANLDQRTGESYLARIFDDRAWDSCFVDARRETAVSVRR
jgi:predicted O-methyltransferase YrrM